MASNMKMSLKKLLVDKKNNRVVFAESGPEFVDILFSFLTLPMGTIIRLNRMITDKKKPNTGCMEGLCEGIRTIIELTNEDESKIGCIDELYKCFEDLNVQYLHTEACKAMLLSPRMERDSQRKCDHLVLEIDDDLEHKDLYSCTNWTCRIKTHCLISMFKYSTCLCGTMMHNKSNLLKGADAEVFVKRITSNFMISDDLNVLPFSTANYLSLLSGFGINDPKDVEERNVFFGKEEVLQLLKQSLVSKTPMTDVFLETRKQPMHELFKDLFLKKQNDGVAPPKSEPFNVTNWDAKCIELKLLVSKSNNKVLYAEANEDFLDVLFSFLTFPLGSIIKLLDRSFSIGCVANMYKSVESLCNDDDNVLLKHCKELLLKPKVASHHGIKNQLLNIEEAKPWQVRGLKCSICFKEKRHSCSHGLGNTNQSFTNPKFVNTATETGGGNVKGPYTFTVTDDLQVKPFSPVHCTYVVCNLGMSFGDLEEKEVIVGEYEALSLLRASMTSHKVLTEVFCQTKTKTKCPGVVDED